MSWRGVGALFAVAAVVVSACSSFSGADTPNDDGGLDGGADTSIPPVMGTALPDSATLPNVLTDGTFESNCAAWKPSGFMVTWDNVHTHNSSLGACRVCFLGDNAPSATLTQKAEFGVGANRHLAASVFVRAASATPALQGDIDTSIIYEAGALGGGATGQTFDITPNEWTQLTLSSTFDTTDGDGVEFKLTAFAADPIGSAGTACFYVDDAYVNFVP